MLRHHPACAWTPLPLRLELWGRGRANATVCWLSMPNIAELTWLSCSSDGDAKRHAREAGIGGGMDEMGGGGYIKGELGF